MVGFSLAAVAVVDALGLTQEVETASAAITRKPRKMPPILLRTGGSIASSSTWPATEMMLVSAPMSDAPSAVLPRPLTARLVFS